MNTGNAWKSRGAKLNNSNLLLPKQKNTQQQKKYIYFPVPIIF